ncbi:retrotransposon protein, putative, ty1-copia subclass, partial [Tanacetum coccineum]
PMEFEGFEPPQEEVVPIRRMKSIKDNQVWRLVDLPPNCKTVGSKCRFKKKTDMDGIVHTYKVRLVAKGYTQTYEIDYEETFLAVADIRAIRILIAITTKVCKLQRSIYGVKQASKSWNKRFDEEIKKFGFAQNLDESCVYQKASGSNVTFLILYVDDIIIMGNHIPSLQSVKDYLGKCFAMKDLGEAAFILGINIPMQERLDLNKSQGAQTPREVKRMQNVPYASAVGSIMYDVRCTRPDVAFAQNITSQFQHNPGEPHWTAMKSILKYLRNTKDMFLVYGGNPSTELRVECYCDAGFETDREERHESQTNMCTSNGRRSNWNRAPSKVHVNVFYIIEYIAALQAAMEAAWIRKSISGLGIVPKINEPLNMYCDNSAVVHYANEPRIQRGSRHYHRRYHYVRECVELGEIKILKAHTNNNLADPFTKALSNRKLTQHARSMRLRPTSSFM